MIQIPSLKKAWVDDINKIISDSLASVDPYHCVSRVLNLDGSTLQIADEQINLLSKNRIFIIGVGKAVLPMAKAIVDTLGAKVSGGFLIPKHSTEEETEYLGSTFDICPGAHPIPDERSIEAALKLQEFIKQIDDNDLIINLISGGGSALMTMPEDGITLNDTKALTGILLKSGATIQEINTIRKHIDRMKGGGLGRMTYPTQMVSLILSDVMGDDISMIASGPTTFDETTFQNSLEIIHEYRIENEIPQSILKHLEKGSRGEVRETVKPGDVFLEKVSNKVVGSLSIAIDSAEETAQGLGFETKILTNNLIGEAKQVGKTIALDFINIIAEHKYLKKPICQIAGGETTVSIQGTGKGGRNQELVLSAIEQLDNHENCCLISLATDGEDGPTDAAGAYITGRSFRDAKEKGLDPQKFIENNDSYTFFEHLGNLIKIGPTGTNVNDLLFLFCFE